MKNPLRQLPTPNSQFPIPKPPESQQIDSSWMLGVGGWELIMAFSARS
jgi:hypothetical protein